MMHTKKSTAFARGGRLTPAEMRLGDEAREVWLAVTSNKFLRALLMQSPLRHIVYRVRRKSERSDPLELLSVIIVTMAAVGFPESTVDLLIVHLQGVKARCYVGNAHRSLEELDVEETQLEAQENELVLMRRIAGDRVTAEQLLREAEINEREATLQVERAKELRRQARLGAGRVLPFRRDFPRPMGVTS